jgi:hypothetical protein
MLLREALEVWRGTALADFVYEPFAQVEIERLEELRIAVLSERIDADLALGRHLDLVGELEALVQQHPLHERLREQLMVALYRSGLQAEALELYQDTRRALVGELGLEPGPELQRLERAILTHDPALDLTATHRLRRGNIRTPRPRWRGQLLAVAVAAVILGVALAVLLEHSAGLVAKPPNSVGVIDPKTNALVARLAVGGGASGIAANSRSVWVMNAFDLTVSYINARTEHVLATTAVWANGGGLTAITYATARPG